MKIAVTGANSSVGKNLLAQLVNQDKITIIAGVRSKNAFASLPSSPQIDPRVIAYDEADALSENFSGADCVVHLAGILIESKHSSYETANVGATASVVAAAKRAGVKHLVFISVIGASADSSNAYFRSKGRAENLVAESGLSASIIRTPILMGPGTAGADSLLAIASRPRANVLGGGKYTMRPLDVDDLSHAILQCCKTQAAGATTHELVGPDSIQYSELIRLTAELLGNQIQIASIPVRVAKIIAAITSRIKGGGMSPAVIDVITANEVVQENADRALGITLTPLQSTINKILEKKPTP